MSEIIPCDTFEALRLGECEEIAICVAGAAKDNVAVGALMVTLESGGHPRTLVATSPVGSEIDWGYTDDTSDSLPPPHTAQAAEWYALTFAITKAFPKTRYVVYTASRPILDFLRGAAPFSSQPWLFHRQTAIVTRYAAKKVRIAGRIYMRLQTRKEAAHKTRVTTSDLPILVPKLATRAQVAPLLVHAKEVVERVLHERVK